MAPQQKSPILTYKEVMLYIKMLIKDTFELDYATTILPSLSDERGILKNPMPKQTEYAEFITSCTLHVITGMDTFLKKSALIYVSDTDLKNTVIIQIKKMLDTNLAKHIMAVAMTGQNSMDALNQFGTVAQPKRNKQVKRR